MFGKSKYDFLFINGLDQAKELKVAQRFGTAINYFLLSYMVMGHAFYRYGFLQKENIVDGRIKFQRKKTSKMFDITIAEQMQEILKFYTSKKKRKDFILSIIKRASLEPQYKDAQWGFKNENKVMKTIAELSKSEMFYLLCI